MKREPNYKKMYLEMLRGVEDAISALSNSSQAGSHETAVTALRVLIAAEIKSEDIYLRSTDESLVYLYENT